MTLTSFPLMVESTTSTPYYLLHIGLRAKGGIISSSKSSHFLPQEPEASIKTNGFHPEVEVEDPRIAPRLAPTQSLVAPSPQVRTRAFFLFRITQYVGPALIIDITTFHLQDVQHDSISAPVPAPLPTLPPAPLLEPSFNFLQDSQVTIQCTFYSSYYTW